MNYQPVCDLLHLREVKEGLVVGDIVEAQIVVGEDDRLGWVPLPGPGHQHLPCTCLHQLLGVLGVLHQAPVNTLCQGTNTIGESNTNDDQTHKCLRPADNPDHDATAK